MYQILDWNTGLTENSTNLLDILQFVKTFLDGENTIAVLQQIPYKLKDIDGKWIYSDSYNVFVNTFSKEKYMVISNDTYNKGYVFMQTVIVTRIKGFPPKNNSIYPSGTFLWNYGGKQICNRPS